MRDVFTILLMVFSTLTGPTDTLGGSGGSVKESPNKHITGINVDFETY